MSNNSSVPVVEVTRGRWVESVHRGMVAVVDSHGRLVASLGNPKEPIYLRSSAKPFQALALVCSGAAKALGVTEEELAVVCGSHSGEPLHLELVTSLLRKAGLSVTDLQCGIHPPFDPAARRTLAAQGEGPSALHNNCSGKHAGMLATALYLGLPLEGYTSPDHEVQAAIRGLIAFLAGTESEEIEVATDGCTAPTFLLPLRSFALAMSRLAAAGTEAMPPSNGREAIEDEVTRERRRRSGQDPSADDAAADDYADPDDAMSISDPAEQDGDDSLEDDDGFPVSIPQALRQVWQAMLHHPVLVAGSRGRLCTDLMRVAARAGIPLVAKSGAEGVYAMAVSHQGQSLGIALKIEDGAERARNAVAVETLHQLRILPEEACEMLAGYHHPPVFNRQSEPVGEVRAHFRLNLGL